MQNENQQAVQRKNITLFRIEKKDPKSPDYNGSIDWPLTAESTEEERKNAKICDVLMWRGLSGTKKRFTGMLIYTDEVANVIGKATERFSFLITVENENPEKGGPNISGFFKTDDGESMRCSLWLKSHSNVKSGNYYSGSLTPEVDMSKVGGF